ncbi:MAG: sensor histidine kinase [Candidatus Binataceae bacterium]
MGAFATTGDSGETVARPVIAPARRDSFSARRLVIDFDDNFEAIDILKKSGPVGIFFLLAYILVDARAAARSGRPLLVTPYHWMALAIVLLFFGLTWLPAFRRHWRLWSLLCCIAMMLLIVRISAITHDSMTRYITIFLCPFATAAFVIWGWRWQLSLIVACFIVYVGAQVFVPIGPRFQSHALLGLVAALALSQFTAVFLDRYRRRLRAQLVQLADAATFREAQIATMTHDIRNPLATLVGLVTLLVEDHISDKERSNLLSRVWSTTTSMDLLVKNVLDLYLLDERRLRPNWRMVDTNAVVAETADRCAMEARLKNIKLKLELGAVPRANLDPLHLERIAANLLTSAVRRTPAGEVRLRTLQRGNWIVLELSDTGPVASKREIDQIFERPNLAVDGARSAALGRYIACALVQADGGHMQAHTGSGWGLHLIVELPISQADPVQS